MPNYYWNPPQGEQTSLGIAKETTPGTFPGMASAIWHRAITPDFKASNDPIERTGAAKRYDPTYPGTGLYIGSGDVEVEPQPDTIGQLLAYARGSQSVPSLNIYTGALSAATLTSATAFPVGGTRPIPLVPGMKITIDTSTNQETLTLANPAVTASGGVYSLNTTSGATKAHSNGVQVTVVSTSAYYSKLTAGLLPYFSAQLSRVIDTVDILGNMIESAAFTLSPKNVGIKFATKNLWEQIDASSVSPVFSNKYPYQFENPDNWIELGGVMIGVPGSSVSVRQLTAQLNNNLGVVPSGAAGRRYYAFLQQQKKVDGTLTLGFEDDSAYELFLGASGATSPQFPIAPTSLAWVMAGQDVIDSANGIPFVLAIEFPNVFPKGDPVPIKSTGELTQTFQIEAAESGPGNNDAMVIHLITASSSVY